MSRKITTIIPFFNNESTLPMMLDSILNGILVPDEIILIDDGSTDNSANIAKDYQRKNSFIKYYYQDHAGVSTARNLGLSNASGDWISFLDADDFIEKNMYKAMVDSLADNPECMGCIAGYYTENNGISTTYVYSESSIIKSQDLLEKMFSNDNIRGFLFTRLFHVSLLKNIYFDPEISICEDLLFQTQLFLSNNDVKFAVCQAPIYHYVQNASSATNGKNLFKNGIFIYQPAFGKIHTLLNYNYVTETYKQIIEFSMYNELILYKNGQKSAVTQINFLKQELRKLPWGRISIHSLLYRTFPLLYIYFI